jgi:iron(III) transport system substrate-binding protein
VLEQEGMLTPYSPKGVEKLNQRFVDTKKPPMWVGMDVWGATICFNTVEAQKRNLPKPESWKDLLKPIYKGQITMPHPASSGTGFLDVTGVAAALRRGRGVEVHGRAAREHRAVRALRAPSRAARPAPANS